ncbi:hypothetical protein [Sphingomonas oryzagri]
MPTGSFAADERMVGFRATVGPIRAGIGTGWWKEEGRLVAKFAGTLSWRSPIRDMASITRRGRRRFLIGAVVGAALSAGAQIGYTGVQARQKATHQLLLVYYVPKLPFPAAGDQGKPFSEYPSLWNGDPARSWNGGPPYLLSAAYRCGLRAFQFRMYEGMDTGWSNAVDKEVMLIAPTDLKTNTGHCLMGLVNPPHVLASLPAQNQVEADITDMIRFNPPLG